MAQIRKGPSPDPATFPAVPSVNLLDPSVEPTDEELAALMQDFMKVVTERDKAGRIALQRDLDRCIRGAADSSGDETGARREPAP